MIKGLKYILFVLVVSLFSACISGLETRELSKDRMASIHTGPSGTGEEDGGLPVLAFNDGDLMKASWWVGAGDLAMSQGSVFEIKAKNIGPNYTPFGATLPPIDFIKEPVAIRVKARAEGQDGTMPTLALQFDDMEGYQANAKRPTVRIGNTEEFNTYYFDCRDIWVQSWPSAHKVNGAMVNKLMFFINPGGAGYTGKLFIEEIQVIPADEIQESATFKMAVGKDGGMIDDFENGIDSWWADPKYDISQTDDGALKMVASGVGPNYEPIGTGFPAINMLHAYEIIVKARIEGEVPPEMRIDVKDPDGYTTNSRPATNRIYPTENGEYKEYKFRFKDRWLQTYPFRKDVDGERIVELMIFINAGKAPWEGTIYIDEIEAVFTGIPEDEKKDEEKANEPAPDKIVIDDFSKPIYSWWSSDDDKISLEKEGNTLAVTANGAGPGKESFGRGFSTVDFTKTPILKVKVKGEGSGTVNLRADIKDIDGNATNASPVVKVVKLGEGVQELQFDFTDKFKQASPSKADVNAKEILEVMFFINPEGEAFSGKLFVEEITTEKK